VIAAFVLVLGSTGGLPGLSADSVPWAEAVAPAGDDDDDDDDAGPDLDDLSCEEIIELAWEIFILDDPDGHAPFIDLDELEFLALECLLGPTNIAGIQQSFVSGLPFNMTIEPQNPATSNFVGVSGVYDPNTGMYQGEGEGTVAGFPNIEVEMDITIDLQGNVTGTYAMGTDGDLPPGNGNGNPAVYSINGTIPLVTPSDTPTPVPTDTPTPTQPAGQTVVWGNHNCSGDPLGPPDPVDALLNLRHDAGLSTNTGDCPAMGSQQALVASNGLIWGDVDCDGTAGPVDSLKVLRFDAGLSVSQGDPCPEMGAEITIGAG
jgi:hypothetical protein